MPTLFKVDNPPRHLPKKRCSIEDESDVPRKCRIELNKSISRTIEDVVRASRESIGYNRIKAIIIYSTVIRIMVY